MIKIFVGLCFFIFFASCELSLGATPIIKATPTVLQNSGDPVTISWANFQQRTKEAVIGIFSPASTIKEDLKSIIGFLNVTQDSGSLQLPLLNARFDYAFGLINVSKSHESYEFKLVAVSNNVSFQNPLIHSQPRLSLTSNPSEMKLIWTSGSSKQSSVTFWPTSNASESITVVASSQTYTISEMCGFPANDTRFYRDPGNFYTAVMTNLQPSTQYSYYFGSADGKSSIFQFTSSPGVGADISVNFLVYGDMGVVPPFGIFTEVQNAAIETQQNIMKTMKNDPTVSLVVHIGDISYARGYMFLWDWFMDAISPISGSAPYMVCIGNHEYDYLGQPFKPSWSNYGTDSGGECGVAYDRRFSMPGTGPTANLWYSYNYGPVHFILMSTEHDFTPNSAQYNWIMSDLASIDRSVTPWVLFLGHRPMYTTSTTLPPDFIGAHMRLYLEPMLVKAKVDMMLWGHVHSYERTCGMVNFTCSDQDEDAPVHVVIGNAGNVYQVPWERQYTEHRIEPDWIVYRTTAYGYQQIKANATTLVLQAYGNRRNEIHDSLVLKKSAKSKN